MANYDFTFTILLLGDPSTKYFLNRYCIPLFYDNLKLTIGVEFYSKTTKFHGKIVKLQIWHWPGEVI